MLEQQDAVDPTGTNFDAAAWRAAKPALLAAMQHLPRHARQDRKRWIVSDFVTLGSPLTHARYLSADGDTRAAMEASSARKQKKRELPRDPAMRVGGDGTLFFRVPPDRRAFFHPAGLFGVTRWTNLHFPLRAAIFGDVVGGQVCDVFGRGILDQEVPIRGFPSLSAHTHCSIRRCRVPRISSRCATRLICEERGWPRRPEHRVCCHPARGVLRCTRRGRE